MYLIPALISRMQSRSRLPSQFGDPKSTKRGRATNRERANFRVLVPMSESATFFTLSVSRLSCQSRRNSASRVLPLFFLLAAAPGRTGSHILPTSVCPLSQFDILHERGRRRSKALNLLLFPSDVGK